MRNIKQFAESYKRTASLKRQKRFMDLKPQCRICKKHFSYEDFCSGKRDFCGSKECRSTVNAINSSFQDKTKISEAVKNSKKWQLSQQASLIKRKSKAENAIYKMMLDLFPNVQEQILLTNKNGQHHFLDIVIGNVIIEVDGPYHDESKDKALNDFILAENKCLIRFNVKNKKWYDIMSEVGQLILAVRNAHPGVHKI